jgi:hypothetical protein
MKTSGDIIAICMCLLAIVGMANGQNKSSLWETSQYGQTMLRPFPHAPYPHSSRMKGYTNDGQVFPYKDHYDDSTVGIFIPKDYKPGDVVNYVVHFHGWHNYVANVLTHYELPRQMEQAHVNAILVVPQGPKNAADSGDGKLELDPGAFEKLMNEVTDFLYEQGKIHTRDIGKITLSTHSGGFKVVAAILDHGGLASHITDVCLLDSTYNGRDIFAKWCAASPEHRLVSFHTQHLNDANEDLRDQLDKLHVAWRTVPDFELKDKDFKSRGVLIVPTLLPHDEVPMGHDYFRRVIRYSDFGE